MIRPILILLCLAALLSVGCQGKTPEEIEAAKYPKTAPLTAEQQAKVDAMSQQPWEQSKSQPDGGRPSGG